MCHHVKHIGFAQILAQQGKLDYDAVVNHFLKVNEVPREVFTRHLQESYVQWNERSKVCWKLDTKGIK